MLYGLILVLSLTLAGIQWRLYSARFVPIEVPLVIGRPIGELGQVPFESHLGHPLTLESISQDGMVLRFLHTECGYCQLDVPLWHILGEETVVMGVTEETEVETVRTYAEMNAIDFPIILDAGGALSDHFGVIGTPTKYALSNELEILQQWVGLTTQESPQSEIGGLYTMFGIHPSYLPESALFSPQWLNRLSPR